ncbi:HhoA/HhoB/HtrA family serine endopeptidase [Chroococcidiopsis sp. CCNUC1]|uniref:HhoA/HhoB/HtrA family serine endopeptidase n=1 Tax=Chroococcidiopsis sp. CCNUC1 TaxID=2653189 RepID=UPI000D05109D|nr:HhoA/HhoB/HtrA family serine endopeptidase [Chroococcidiopsis sp. CCNUC1]PSB44680.1 serine protease [Cyanosarcina cf. burmensis CCALA 770]URD50396.1 trypsin-like peptidase domain-containing protein [Chroococcidiopsis sp. CCNUC1]
MSSRQRNIESRPEPQERKPRRLQLDGTEKTPGSNRNGFGGYFFGNTGNLVKTNLVGLVRKSLSDKVGGDRWRLSGTAGRKALTLISGVLCVSLSSCAAITEPFRQSQAQQTPIAPSPVVPAPTGTPRAALPSVSDPNFVVAAVQKVGPAVVRINASRTVKRQLPEAFEDPLFRRFFGVPEAQPRERIVRGTGSGFIISANGQILTNAHVVNGADRVSVTLKDGRTLEGKVLGEDPVTDIAVIQVQSNNLPVVEIGNSDELQPGEWVIAIGNPLGLDNTVTAGIVSATDRSASDIGVTDKRIGFIQTDAAINPGNSGGPLLNSRGEVIGMNTAIIQGAQGLGFSIPINAVQRISKQLIATGSVQHPYLGVQMVTLTPEIRQQLEVESDGQIQIPVESGVLVVRVVPNSPAAAAGIRSGDVIQSINNQPVAKTEQVQQIVEQSSVGTQVSVQVQRNGKTAQLSVKLANLPAQQES